MRLSIYPTTLAAFLREAKQVTFAGGEDAKRLRDGGRLYEYHRGEWTYRDRYYGSRFDSGLEMVALRGVPVWAMVYRGGMLPPYDQDAPEVFAFLKEALRQPRPDLPLRGPAQVISGRWRYTCRIRGSLLEFSGRETIQRGARRVYHRTFSGGALRHRRHTIEFMQ